MGGRVITHHLQIHHALILPCRISFGQENFKWKWHQRWLPSWGGVMDAWIQFSGQIIGKSHEPHCKRSKGSSLISGKSRIGEILWFGQIHLESSTIVVDRPWIAKTGRFKLEGKIITPKFIPETSHVNQPGKSFLKNYVSWSPFQELIPFVKIHLFIDKAPAGLTWWDRKLQRCHQTRPKSPRISKRFVGDLWLRLWYCYSKMWFATK